MIRISVLTVAAAAATLGAAPYFVSPTGDDGAAGTSGAPLKTPQAAFAKMAAGDTVYLRGGTYALSAQVKPNVSGASGNLCKLWAYNGEKPVFDFTGLSDRGLYISKDYWHVRGIEVKNAGSNGICLSTGGHHIIEGCVAHDNGLEGIKLTNGAHDCLVLNCDSYRNYDAPNNGENADGFAAKSGVGEGNVFRGCRAWLNADDGWDFYGCPAAILVDSCFAFRNGINIWGNSSWAGDGNAFKLGGAGDTSEMIVTRSVAFDNVSKGFDQNHTTAGQTIYNCTGFRNGAANFSFYETPTGGTLKKHVLKNNISFSGGAPTIDATATLASNSWQGMTVSAADFQSIDTSLALAPRTVDYRLPNNGFLRLAASSQLINKGVDVGLPYGGSAPDLGAFEYGGSAVLTGPALAGPSGVCSWSPKTGLLRVKTGSFGPQIQEATVFDLWGRRVACIMGRSAAAHIAVFDLNGLTRGTYCVHLTDTGGGHNERISLW
ncbi:MAG: right-handed parallel beta-helix repeat-containing protein [Chitinispirillaceae bacterium]|nr:right-handed parallel beta-helix repeat-containing protein [Chitinispirillaceae bacterium]